MEKDEDQERLYWPMDRAIAVSPLLIIVYVPAAASAAM
jgi:hypothetical protein